MGGWLDPSIATSYTSDVGCDMNLYQRDVEVEKRDRVETVGGVGWELKVKVELLSETSDSE